MSSHYRDLFTGAHERPSMYALDGSFASATAFVLGCDAGNGRALLNSFEEWLIPQVDTGERNLAWTTLVLRLAFPDGTPERPWSDADDRHALDTMFRLLDEYLALDPARPLIRRAIFARYFEWQRERGLESSAPERGTPI